jgi:hypothetical protein
MRSLFTLILVLLPLAACTGSPEALGITGPETNGPHSTDATRNAVPPGATSSDPFENQEAPQAGGQYGPSMRPTTNGGRFWNYN